MRIYYGAMDRKMTPSNHTVSVVSVNRLACEKDHMTLRKNGREDWSLFYCEEGVMYFENTQIKSGQLWIYPPSVPQKYMMFGKDHTVYRYLHFTGSDVSSLFSSLGIKPLSPIKVNCSVMLDAFEKVQKYQSDDSPLSKLKTEYHTLYLFSRIVPKGIAESQSGMMKRITDDMEHSFAEKYDAARFARMLKMSVSRFNHLFKETVGKSPYAYFLELRLDNAAALLESTDLKIKDVAEQCGFEDALYFTQAFKKSKALTPTQYRKQNK